MTLDSSRLRLKKFLSEGISSEYYQPYDHGVLANFSITVTEYLR